MAQTLKSKVIREFLNDLEERGYVIVKPEDTAWMRSRIGTTEFMEEMGYEK